MAVKLPGSDTDWEQSWNDLTEAMERHADAAERQQQPPAESAPAPSFVEQIQRAIAPPAEAQPAAPESAQPQPDPNPGLTGWEELRRRRRQQPIEEPKPDPNVGQSFLSRELEQSGWFATREAEHAGEREATRQDAIRQTTEAEAQQTVTSQARDIAREVPWWLTEHVAQFPGSVIVGVGSAVQAPDTVAAQLELAAQHRRLRHIEIGDRIDGGETWMQATTPRRPGSIRDRRYEDFAKAYQAMTPPQRLAERARIEAEIEAFNPTPVADRPFYQTGEAIQQRGRELIPHVPGYTEQSVSTQLSRGLGSMAVGLVTSRFLGPAGSAAVFGSMGISEATQRAVEFDKKERAEGREGLSHQQIVLSGMLGVAPGLTDVLPVELLLTQARIPGMTPVARRALAEAITKLGGRVVLQALAEGTQESIQQIMQNLIALKVYNPGQEITEGAAWNAIIGGGVGAEAEVARTALARFTRRSGGTRTQPQPQPAPQPQPQAQPQPPQTAAPAPTEQAEEEEEQPAEERQPFGIDRWSGPQPAPAAPQEGAGERQAAPAPQATPDAEGAPAASPSRIAAMADQLAQTGPLPAEVLDALRRFDPDLAAKYEVPVPREDVQRVAQIADIGDIANLRLGQSREIVTPGNEMTVQAVPEIVELSDLTAASGVLQPRDRSRAEAQQAVREIASRLDPEQLMPGRVSDAGAPVVTADGVVISGNGRVAAIRQAYVQAPLRERGKAYRAALGEAARRFKRPVLIMRLREMPEAELARFADLSNRARISAMSATERAQRDAAAAGPDVMGLYQGGPFTSPANSEFFRGFITRVITAAERGAFSRQGDLTQEGQKRLQGAVLAAAYGNTDILAKLLESTDDTARSLVGALNDAAGSFIRLRASIARGEASAEFDITAQLVDAVQRVMHIRDRGVKPAEYLAQQDAFTQIDPIAEALIRSFYSDNLGRALGRQRLTEFLNAYAAEAQNHTTTTGLIEDATTPLDVIRGAYERATRADTLAARLAGAQGDIFAPRPSAGVGGAPSDGQPAQGREPEGRGREAGAERVEPADDADLARRFASILAGKLPRAKWAKSLGISDEQLDGLIERAVGAGLLRIDKNGVARRTPLAKSAPLDVLVSEEDIEAEKLAGRFAPTSKPLVALTSDRQGRNEARTAMLVGKAYRIDDRHVAEVWDLVSSRAHEFPPYVRPAVLQELRPLPVTPERVAVAVQLGQEVVDTLAIFSMPDGTVWTKPLPRKFALTTRGLFLQDDGILGFMSFGGRGDRLDKAIAGVQRHELVHALRFGARFGEGIPPADWLALVVHAKHLRMLDMRLAEYIEHIGQQQSKQDSKNPTTLLQIYQRTYARYGDQRDAFIDEEYVAHMTELRALGLLPDQAVAPVKDILDRLIAGYYAQPRNVQQAMLEREDLDDTQLHALHVAQVDEFAASALEALNRPETTPQQALDLIEELRQLRAERDRLGLDPLLAVGPEWTDADIAELREADLEEAERKMRRREYIGDRPLKGLAPDPEGPADRFMREIREYEKRLVGEGKNVDQIAAGLRERFGIDVDKEQLASGVVWWRIDELLQDPSKGRIRWTIKADTELRKAWESGLSIAALRDHLANVLERPRLSFSAVAGRALQLGVHLRARNAWTPDLDEALLSPEIRNLKAKDAAKALGERFPGRSFNQDIVTFHRRRHGQQILFQYSEAAQTFVATPEATRLKPAELAAELSRLEGRTVLPKAATNLRTRLKREGFDVGSAEWRQARFWTPDLVKRATDYLASNEGRQLSGNERIAEALTGVLERPVTASQFNALRAMMRSRGTPLASRTGTAWWQPEEMAAFDKARADKMPYAEIAAFLKREFGRETNPSSLAAMAMRRRRQGDAASDELLAAFAAPPVGLSQEEIAALPLDRAPDALTEKEVADGYSTASRLTIDVYGVPVTVRELGRPKDNRLVLVDPETGRLAYAFARDQAQSEQVARWYAERTARARIGGNAQMLAAFSGQPPGDGPVKPLRDIIRDLKDALEMVTTPGLQRRLEVVDRTRGVRRIFRPRANVRAQYDRDAGVARIREHATDIHAIAHEGGHHLERLFGPELEAFKQQHLDELGVLPAPNVPMPTLSPTGFSTLDLDADTQAVLIAAANGMRHWRQLMAAPNRRARQSNASAVRQVAGQTAIAMGTLERRLGATIARGLVGDLLGDPGLPNNGVIGQTPHRYSNPSMRGMIDPAMLAQYVRERYTPPGTTPRPRPAPTVAPEVLSEGFARFFQRYVTDPKEAERVNPGVYQAFEDFLDAEHPALLEDLQRLQIVATSQAYQEYKQATTLARGRADLASDADQRFTTWLGRLRQAVGEVDNWKAFANYLYTAGVNSNRPHDRMVRRFLERADANRKTDADGRAISLEVHENPAKLVRALGDSFKTGLRWLQDGMPTYKHADAGYQVVDSTGQPVGPVLPNLAQVQAAAAAMPGASFVSVRGKRSRSINEAMTIAGVWDDMDAYKDFGMFLESRRAVEEWKRWEAQGSKPQADGKGLQREPHRIDRAEHEERVRQLDQKYPQFRRAADAVYDFLWASALHDHAAGRLSTEELAYRATRRSYYVPWSRDFSDTYDLGVRGTRARLRRFRRDMAFRGSKRDIVHPIETVVDQAFSRAAGTAFNNIMQSYANLAEAVGPGGGAIAERVTKTEILDATNEAFRRLEADLQGMGYDATDARAIVQRLETQWGDPQLMLTSTAPTAGKPLMVPLWENGKRGFLRINDPQLAQDIFENLNGLGAEMSSLFIDFAAAPARMLRIGVTTSAGFFFPNLIRDSWAAWILTGALPIVTQARGLYHELRQTDTARLYQEVGGILGGVNVASLPRVKDKLDVMELKYQGLPFYAPGVVAGAAVGGGLGFMLGGPGGAAFGALVGMGFHRGVRRFGESVAHFADMSETATRLGVFSRAYQTALRYNPELTPYQAAQEAAFVARDLIDFGRHGSKMIHAARLIAFTNAAIQGNDRAVRGLLARSDRGAQFSPTKLVGVIAAGAGAGLAVGGPVGAVVGGLVAPAAATNMAARNSAVRALLLPFYKRMSGLPTSRDDQRAMAQSAGTWARLIGYTLALVAFGLYYFDDDRYRRIDPRTRNRNQPLLPMDDTAIAEWASMPKSWEWGIPSSLIEAAVDLQFRGDPRFWARAREAVWDGMVPSGVPQIMTLYGDIRSNYDSFRQRPLVPERQRKLSPEEQFDSYSSQLAIEISRFVNSRDYLRVPVEGVGSTVFSTKFELSPAVIDHVLRTGFGHWGTDIQRASDYAAFGASRWRDYPLIGGLLQRFVVDPNRQSDAVRAYYETLERQHEGYSRAAFSYAEKLTRYANPREANAWLAALSQEQRAYALLQNTGTTEEKRRHPMNRLASIMNVTGDIVREIRLQRFGSTADPLRPRPIELTSDQRLQVMQVISLVRAVEANNTFVTLRHEQFANLNLLDARQAHDLLRAISPDAAAELQRRLQRAHTSSASDMARWPNDRDRILRQWQNAVDRDAALENRRLGGRRRIRLPIGSNPPTQPQPQPEMQ